MKKLNIIATFLLIFSLILVSPVLAESNVDIDLNWIGTNVAPNYEEGDVVSFNSLTTNYGADYIETVVELSRVDGQPITTLDFGQGVDLTILTVFENYSITDLVYSKDVSFPTTEFTYAGYTFDIPEGDYELRATSRGYVGSNYDTVYDHLYFRLSENIIIEPGQLSLVIDCNDTLEAGDVITCEAIVTDENNAYVENATVVFNDGLFGTCTTDAQGFCSIDYTTQSYLIPDTYYIEAVASKENYDNATALTSFDIVETYVEPDLLNIINYICDTPLYFGDYMNCTLQVVDQDNNFINDADVDFTLNGIELGIVTNNVNTYYVTFQVPELTDIGDYLIRADANKVDYEGDTEYFQVNLMQHELSLNIDCYDTVIVGNDLVCQANVLDENNVAMQNSNVEFTLNSQTTSCTTDAQGNCDVSYLIDDSYEADTIYNIDAVATKEFYVEAYASDTVQILNYGMSLTIDCTNQLYIGDTLVCEANVLDENNVALTNADVEFRLEGQTSTCTTDTTGTCEISFLIDETFEEDTVYMVDAVASKVNYYDAFASITFYVIPTVIPDEEEMELEIDCTDEIYLEDELVCKATVTENMNIIEEILKYVYINLGAVEDAEVRFQIDTEQHNQEFVCITDKNGECEVSKDILSVYGYQEDETYTVQAIATKDGYVDSKDMDTFYILTTSADEDPTAIIIAENQAEVNQEVNFDGSYSYAEGDATLVEYSWTITDANNNILVDAWTGGQSVDYTFAEEGLYTVILTVTDSNDLDDIATHVISIEDNYEPNGNDEIEGSSENGIKVDYFRITGLDDSIAKVGGDFEVTAVIESYATKDLDNVRMTFYLPEYGIEFKSFATDLDVGQKKRIVLDGFLPYDIEPGIYYPMIGISDTEIRRMKVGYLEIVD